MSTWKEYNNESARSFKELTCRQITLAGEKLIELLREFCEKVQKIKLTGLLKFVPDIHIKITGSIALAVVEEQARLWKAGRSSSKICDRRQIYQQ